VVPSDYVTELRAGEAKVWSASSPLIGRLDIELTERCNNNCAHCYINLPANDAAAKARELSTREIQDILIEAASLGCLTVRFTGGEPLLRDDFRLLYLFARRLGLKVLLFTNATLITQEIADLFARVPPLERIEVTVYGMCRDSYEAVSRVAGSFEAAWRGMELLLDKQIPFVVKGALLPANKGELAEFETWASTIPWMDKPPSFSMFFDLRCRRDSEAKNRHIRRLRLQPDGAMQVLARDRERYVKGTTEFCQKFMAPAGDLLFSCGSGQGGGCVDAYGSFQPCMMLRHPDTIYDLKNGSLREALTVFFPQLREMKATNADYLARCARCFLKGLCEQCPAKSWMEHGTLDTPVEYLCEVAHTQARYLGLLAEGEHGWEVGDWRERIKRLSAEE
jgi:radical SAM protein with 4Fe4S-binding SPASM domain